MQVRCGQPLNLGVDDETFEVKGRDVEFKLNLQLSRCLHFEVFTSETMETFKFNFPLKCEVRGKRSTLWTSQ